MKEKKSLLSNLKFDLASGLVVFFVALPLCLGISLASTAYAETETLEAFKGVVFPGLIAGIVGGIVVGSLSGSRFGVSGPAAGLITIVSVAIMEFGGFQNGGFEKFILAVAIAGVFQLILGFIQAGFLAYYIPFSVIKGMLAGIGVTIIMKEIPHFFGYDKDVEGDMNFEQVDGHNTFTELYYMTDNVHIGATIVGLISLAILIVWGFKFVKKSKILSMIPGPLIAIIISIIVAVLFSSVPGMMISAEHLVQVPTPSSMEEFKSQFYTPDFSALKDYHVYVVALTIAAVASIETLLCVEATDKMDPYKGRTPMNRELKAQGVGNLVSGLLGGLPITQVIVRSSANIDSGAKSKTSAVLHGIFLLSFILLVPGLLNMIPRSTLAAVLILIGYKLASPATIKKMINVGWEQAVPFFVVIFAMLFSDLLKGVGAGLVVAFLIILYRNYRMSYFVKGENGDENQPIKLTLSQHATFLNKASILKTLDEIEDGKEVIIDFSHTLDVDYDVRQVIEEFQQSAKDREISVTIINRDGTIEKQEFEEERE
ncbi:MAG: SulP family inorganic anion transporter [Crocinitomicaceae bacterium]